MSRPGLRAKIVAISLTILLLGMTLNGVFSARLFRAGYHQSLAGEARVVARHLGLQLDRILEFGIALEDLSGFGNQCGEVVRENPNIEMAMVVDSRGRILFHSDPNREGGFLSGIEQAALGRSNVSMATRARAAHGEYYYEQSPLNSDTANGASVVVGFPKSLIESKGRRLVAWDIIFGAVAVVICAAMLVVSLSLSISRPLDRMLATIREIREGKDLTKRLEVKSNDELGALADSFNQMTERLAIARDELETRVDQRTAQLVEANRELEESKNRFAEVMQAAGAWIWEIDESGLFTYSSPAVHDLLGYSPEEIVGQKRFHELFLPEAQRELRTLIETSMTRRTTFSRIPAPHMHENGNAVILETSGGPVFDNEGNFRGYRGSNSDITARMRAQDALRDSREFLNKIINAIRDPVYVQDEQHRVILVNDAMCELVDKPRQDVLGKTIIGLIRSTEGREIWLRDKGILKSGQETTAEERITSHASQKKMICLSKKSIYVDPLGKRFLVSVMRDITDLKDFEQSLERANETLEQRVAQRTHDLEEAYERISQAQADLVEAEKMGMLGELVAGVAHEINTPTGAIMNVVQDLNEKMHMFSKASLRSSRCTPEITEWLGEVACSTLTRQACIIQPDTRAQRELLRRCRQLGFEHPQPAADAITACGLDVDDTVIVKRLKDPVVMDFLSHLASLKSSCEICAASVRKITLIVKALRYYSRSSDDEQFDVDINESIDNTLVILQNRVKRLARIKRNFQQPLPTYKCGPHITQVWTNILCNACDAIEEQGPRHEPALIKITTAHEDDNIVVEIFNEGPHIPSEVIGKIFEPFVTTKDLGKGTGLGLSICASIVRKYSGIIEARNVDGGVSFTVTLPRNHDDVEDPSPLRPEHS